MSFKTRCEPDWLIGLKTTAGILKEFVHENYQRFKHLFLSKHEKKPKPSKGLEGMYSLKRLSEMI